MLFAAKSYWPGITADEYERTATERDLTAASGDVRAAYRGALLFADDELVLCLFESRFATDVREATECMHIPCERIMALAWLPAPVAAGQQRRRHRLSWRTRDA
jgi:hypothetical protein